MTDGTQHKADLDPEVYIIETQELRTSAIFQATLGYLGSIDGSALWIDACDHATILSRLNVAYDPAAIQFSRPRDGFEHHDMIRRLPAELLPSADLVVVPCVASFYEADSISPRAGEKLLVSTLAALAETAEVTKTPIIATCVTRSRFIDRARELTATSVTIELADTGFRYEPDEFEAAVGARNAPPIPAISGWDGPVHPFAYMGTVQELFDRGFIPDGI